MQVMSILLKAEAGVPPLVSYQPKAALEGHILKTRFDLSVGLPVRWSRSTIHKAHSPLSEHFRWRTPLRRSEKVTSSATATVLVLTVATQPVTL